MGCSAQFHGYLLSALVRKRAPLDLSSFHAQQRRMHDGVHAYLARFGEKRVAIWGAGHQAFALMAMLELGGRIKYVVDSAPFKQGKFTPATHLPIVAASALDTDPVDAVIVICGGYSDEVAKIVRATHGDRIEIAIWRESGLEAS